MANLMIMDYNSNKYDTGINMKDISSIQVTVVSGDELITVCYKDGRISDLIDAMDFAKGWRVMGFFDDSYSVRADELEAWSKREDTYDMSWREE